MAEQITARQFHAADGVDDWRVLYHVVSGHFLTGSLAEGVALVDEIGRLAGGADQHLTIDLRHTSVTVSLKTRDIATARQISAAARALGLKADPTAAQHVHVTIDALVPADVLPFWRAVLGYRQIGDDYLFDPTGRGPCFELQRMDAPRPQRNRMHIDIAVPHEQAEARISAALAAGGHLVSDAQAPKWWILADPEGNEACVATWLSREQVAPRRLPDS
jgi:4a-hydroxytetrahydrobiopterin dehydratase